jgi:hypothetical protein
LGLAEERYDIVGRVVAVDIAPQAAVDKLAATDYKTVLAIAAPGTAHSDTAMEAPVETDIAAVNQVVDSESKM